MDLGQQSGFVEQIEVAAYRHVTHAEQRLLESEERFKILFDTAPVSLIVMDDAGKFIAINQTWINTSGLPRESVFGKAIAEIDFWRDQTDTVEILKVDTILKAVTSKLHANQI